MVRVSVFLGLCLLTFSALAENRIALVIGNANYQTAPLKNPTNDATDMAQRLKKFGFTVDVKLDVDARTMEKAITAFGKKLAQENTVGLFYFAGHGVQIDGRNYLVPIGANIDDEADVKYEAVDAGRVLSKMDLAGNGLNLVILDACRDNPFARSFRSSSRGLARMDAPKGSMILYATSPGDVAQDGTGRNGLFTAKLLKAMDSPGLKVEDIFKQTAIAVSKDSQKKQVPWVEGVILGEFYFDLRGASIQIQSGNPPNTSSQPQQNAETLFIEHMDQSDVDQMKLYLEQFPEGQLSALFKLKIARHNQSSKPKQITQKPPTFKDFFKKSTILNERTLDCSPCNAERRTDKHGLSLSFKHASTPMWTKREVYNLNKHSEVEVLFDAKFSGNFRELIVLFSQNKVSWGQKDPKPDALSIAINGKATDARKHWSTVIRSGMFENFIAHNDQEFGVNTWRSVRLTLTKQKLCMQIEGQDILCGQLSNNDLPNQGYIGFSTSSSEKNDVKFRNITVNRY